MKFFKCKHPADNLVVYKDSTVKPSADYPNDFMVVTHHFTCTKCRERIDIGYSQVIGGFDAAMDRARQRLNSEH